jgi:hypothetical protein
VLTIIYLIGLVIVSISVGTVARATDGFMVLGLGFIVYSMAVGLLNYLNDKKG